MAILDIFSKRKSRQSGAVSDVFVYDRVPQHLRVQIIHILKGTLGNENEYYNLTYQVRKFYDFIHNSLCREYGIFILSGRPNSTDTEQIRFWNFILTENDTEKVLDGIEFGFRLVNNVTREWSYRNDRSSNETADRAIEELNIRLREAGLGYRFEDGMIVRIDSEFAHAEIVKPALTLLSDKRFAGAQQEFMSAFEHHRHGKNKEALADSLKALESVLKVICLSRGWATPDKATCKTLLDTAFRNDLLPNYLVNHFSGLRSALEGGLPTIRNNLGGHGQGGTPTDVPPHFVSYAIHLSAAAIVFLVEADKAKK